MLLHQKIKVRSRSADTSNSDLNPNKSLNRPCPCGSGKKYKDCCFAKDNPEEAAKRLAERNKRKGKK
ncbi:MAG: SEC-C metal-binding domain-containing protein [Corallococcus sp.]|nr:SEC-C metal-binding domain-containing protein [Corallococcus sp.]